MTGHRQEHIEHNLGLVKLLIQVVSMAALLCSVFIVVNTLNINLLGAPGKSACSAAWG